jgi:hypothetical protein
LTKNKETLAVHMRKMFRFKYEPCNGTCYAWCDSLIRRLRELPDSERHLLVTTMVRAHNKLCDNPAYSFGVDVDDSIGVFVGHFRTPEKTDLYSGVDFAAVVNKVCETVLSTEIPTLSGVCVFGGNGAESLGHEILKYCTDLGFAELEETHCECKAHTA